MVALMIETRLDSASKKLRPYMQTHWILVTLVCGVSVALLSIISGGTANGTGYLEAKQIVSCAGARVVDRHLAEAIDHAGRQGLKARGSSWMEAHCHGP